MKKKINFKTAFKYPFNRAKGMWNILWALLPIAGWFALGGYRVRIVQEFSKGKFKQLPAFKFRSDMKLGFFMLLKALPFAITYLALLIVLDSTVKLLGACEWLPVLANTLLAIFVVPVLVINFLNKETVGSFFEFETVKPVFANLGDYAVALLKSILLGVIFLFMSIVLVGIPAGVFTKNIFLVDFYRRKVK